MAALRRRGTSVAPFKVGPDYIDPGYHTLAAGRPGRNLDPVLVGEHRIAPLFRHGAAGAEVAVVEGVMGLFDGRLADGHGSTAHVAGLLGVPVVLVVDCRGQSRSVAALLHGFRSFDPADAGRAGSCSTGWAATGTRPCCAPRATRSGCRCSARCPRRAELAVPSRHLGLVTAAEHGSAATAAVEAMAELVAAHVDLDAVVRLAEPIPPGPAWDRRPSCRAAPRWTNAAFAASKRTPLRSARPVVAVAGGAAFTFGYAEHVELLAAAGRDVAVVDPLHDEALPAGTAALVLPGGFPEEHVAALSANAPLLRRRRGARRVRARPCTPSAAGCSTSARPSTAHRCAGSCPPRPP